MKAALTGKGWLTRRIEVETPEGRFEVVYQGTGLGFEQVLVDGRVAARKASRRWFVPWFEFQIGAQPALLQVEISPWFSFRSLKLIVGGVAVYSE